MSKAELCRGPRGVVVTKIPKVANASVHNTMLDLSLPQQVGSVLLKYTSMKVNAVSDRLKELEQAKPGLRLMMQKQLTPVEIDALPKKESVPRPRLKKRKGR